MLHVRICAGGRPQGRSLPRHLFISFRGWTGPRRVKSSPNRRAVATTHGALPLDGDGTGELILSGSNTCTGRTTINGGTLQLGAGAAGQDGSSIEPAAAGMAAVPEAGTLVLLIAGMIVGFGVRQWKRRVTKDFA